MIDSNSVGDPQKFLVRAQLDEGLAALPPAPQDAGTVQRIAIRHPGGRREIMPAILASPTDGFPGDAWGRSPRRDLDAQLAVMQFDLATLLSGSQPLELSGDNLWLDLDLSRQNLPGGSRLRIGQAELVVTPLPHDGCRKFRDRFGSDALQFVSAPALRHRNLRGVYLRVLQGGLIREHDAVYVVSRAAAG